MSYLPITTAFTDHTALRSRYIQEQDSEAPTSESLTPFTHANQDYYTNPYDTSNDDDSNNNNSDEDINNNTVDVISIQKQTTHVPLSIVTIIWITGCISIVLLVSVCILLGTSKRHHRRMKQHEQEQQQEQIEASILDINVTTNMMTCRNHITKSSSSLHISSTTNSIENGQSNTNIDTIMKDIPKEEVVVGIRNAGKQLGDGSSADDRHQHHRNNNDHPQLDTDTTISSDATTTTTIVDASSSSLSSSSSTLS
jgi:hypothetical protein